MYAIYAQVMNLAYINQAYVQHMYHMVIPFYLFKTISNSIGLVSAPTQEWWDATAEGQARSWQGVVPNPFKPHSQSPLLQIPGGGTPDICKPDLLHVFHLGVGADMALGGILAIFRMGLWKGTNLPACLNNAYDRFQDWCSLHHKSPFIKNFDLQKFHMTSSPGVQL